LRNKIRHKQRAKWCELLQIELISRFCSVKRRVTIAVGNKWGIRGRESNIKMGLRALPLAMIRLLCSNADFGLRNITGALSFQNRTR